MRQIRCVFGALVAVLVMIGCRNPEILNISPDTYLLVRQAKSGFASMATLKAGVISEANAFAQKQGKIAIPLATKEVPMSFGSPIQFEYQFRVVDKDDPEARRTSLVPRANMVIEKTEKISADITTKDKSEKKTDLYTELTKLDDLRKRGLITDAEYETEKKKLLNKN